MSEARRVLFVILPYIDNDTSHPDRSILRSFRAFPYGVTSMATYIKRNSSATVKIFDCNLYNNEEFFAPLNQFLCDFKPDVVGLSMMLDISYQYLGEISRLIKDKLNNVPVVLGGCAATSSYKTIIKEQDNIDGVCYSDGEIPMLDLINSKNISTHLLNHLEWATKESVGKNVSPVSRKIENLDDIIDLDYSFLDIDDYKMMEAFSPHCERIKNRRQFFLITSRGCPFKCVFCMNSTSKDKSMKYASVDAVISHVERLVREYGMNVLTLYDDQILLNKPRAKEIFRRLAQFNLRIECPNGLSVAYIDEEMAMLMAKAGLDTADLAIESGSPYVLRNVIQKPLVLSQVKPVVEALRKHNIWAHGFFVIGIPGETDAHRQETLDFIKSVGLDWCGFNQAIPARGSKLYDMCIENGYIRNDMGIGDLDWKNFIIKTPEYTPEHIQNKIYEMNLDANFVNNYQLKSGKYDLACRIFSEVIKRRPDHAFAHYFLSKAYAGLENHWKEKEHLDKFYSITSKSDMWKKHCKKFGISYERKSVCL